MVPKLSASTLYRWQQVLKAEGVAALGVRHVRDSQSAIKSRPKVEEFVLGMLVAYPHASSQNVRNAMNARFGQVCSLRAIQRYLAGWKEDNKPLFTAMVNPDMWRSKYKAAGGNASAQVVRLNQVWEFDSTKADIMLSDGKRHVIGGVIDVYSRRLKLRVSRSSSSSAVAALLIGCGLWLMNATTAASHK